MCTVEPPNTAALSLAKKQGKTAVKRVTYNVENTSLGFEIGGVVLEGDRLYHY